jgi:hypothetical protein
VKRLLLVLVVAVMSVPAVRAQPAAAPQASTGTATATATSTAAASQLPQPHPSPDVTDWFAGPFAPYLRAWDMDDRGLARYPFDPEDSYNNGVGHQFWTRFSRQFSEGGRGLNHLAAGLRLSDRLGGDFYYSKFRPGSFHFNGAADWLSAHVVADLSVGDATTFEYGFGMATLQGDRSLIGPSAEFRLERRLDAPCTLYGRYALDYLTDGRLWHEASIGVGPSWKRLGAEVGYRLLLNALRNSYGPELSLRIWL